MPRVWGAGNNFGTGPAREEVNAAALQDRFASALGLGSIGKKGGARLQTDVLVRGLQRRRNEASVEEALNLAQCVGLEARPPLPLSRSEWRAVARRSRARLDAGGSEANTCAICLQEFRDEEQLLLSCSHVFHRACLRSFERVSGRIGASCPLCRSKNYEKRKLLDGRERWREACAVRIQAHVRGHLARRRVAAMRAVLPPRDADGRRRFYERKLEEMSDGMIRGMESERADVDSLFRELDASMEMSRALSDRVVERRPAPLSSPPPQLEAAAGARSTPSSSSWSLMRDSATSSACDICWADVLRTANQNYADKDCPICIGPLYRRQTTDEGGSCVALLSCSHCVHVECISRFEKFLDRGVVDGKPDRVSLCPFCRAPYVRKTVRATRTELSLLA